MKLPEPGLAQLRDIFADAARADAPLQRILLVGAQQSGGVLSDNDQLACHLAADSLRRHDLAVAPDAAVDVANLDQGEDFLRQPMPTDLIVIANVRRAGTESAGFHGVSPLHAEPHAWYESAVNSGAKALFIVGAAGDCVSAADFRGPAFREYPVPATPDAALFIRTGNAQAPAPQKAPQPV